jgi:hypothetical protein
MQQEDASVNPLVCIFIITRDKRVLETKTIDVTIKKKTFELGRHFGIIA